MGGSFTYLSRTRPSLPMCFLCTTDSWVFVHRFYHKERPSNAIERHRSSERSIMYRHSLFSGSSLNDVA